MGNFNNKELNKEFFEKKFLKTSIYLLRSNFKKYPKIDNTNFVYF